jgi:hypothetical protein
MSINKIGRKVHTDRIAVGDESFREMAESTPSRRPMVPMGWDLAQKRPREHQENNPRHYYEVGKITRVGKK